jgi:hypothetical protein
MLRHPQNRLEEFAPPRRRDTERKIQRIDTTDAHRFTPMMPGLLRFCVICVHVCAWVVHYSSSVFSAFVCLRGSQFRRFQNSIFVSPRNPRCIHRGLNGCVGFRSGRSIAAVLGFLVLFAILVILVSKFYLMPGIIAAQHATHAHRRKLAAQALLLMCVLLIILLVGLLISFRISRFFFPRPTGPRTRTKVVDAWAEAGKRMEEESPEEEEN